MSLILFYSEISYTGVLSSARFSSGLSRHWIFNIYRQYAIETLMCCAGAVWIMETLQYPMINLQVNKVVSMNQQSKESSNQDLWRLSKCGFILVWLEWCACHCHCPTPTPKFFLHLNVSLMVDTRYSWSNVDILFDIKSSHFSCTFGLQIRDCWNIAVQLKKFVRKIRFEKGKQKNSLLRIKMGTPFVWNWKEKKPQKPQN